MKPNSNFNFSKIPQQQKRCHYICESLEKKGANKSAAVIALLNYNPSNNAQMVKNGVTGNIWVFAAGKEVAGNYKGTYNLCSGGEEHTDYVNGQFCWLNCCKREFFEEFKISCKFSDGSFDFCFQNSTGSIRYFLHHNTPIFIALLPEGTSRSGIKHQMTVDCKNPKLPFCMREMTDFEYFRLDNGNQIENLPLTLSSFANGVRKKIDVNKL